MAMMTPMPVATRKKEAARRIGHRASNGFATTRPLAWSLGLEAPSSDAADEMIRKGFSARALDRFMVALELGREEAAGLLSISTRTLSRRRDEGQLKPNESDRLYRLAHLAGRAAEVLGGPKAARHWLKEPQWALGDRIPLHFAETEAGAREVEDLLGRIEYGVVT